MEKRNLAAAALAGALLAAPVASLAQVQQRTTQQPMFDPSFYAGGGLGYFRVEDQDFFGADDDLDDEQVAFKLYGGMNFNRWLAAELGYVNFGEASETSGDFEAQGATIALIGSWPIGNFAPYVKVGQMFWESESDVLGVSDDEDGNDTFGGLGLQFSMTDNIKLRGEYERYQVEDADIDMASVNLHWQF